MLPKVPKILHNSTSQAYTLHVKHTSKWEFHTCFPYRFYIKQIDICIVEFSVPSRLSTGLYRLQKFFQARKYFRPKNNIQWGQSWSNLFISFIRKTRVRDTNELAALMAERNDQVSK